MICPADIIRAQLKEHTRQNETRNLHIHLLMQQQCASSPTNLTLLTLHSGIGSLQSNIRKVQPRRGHEVPEGEWRYSSTVSLTSALDGVGGQCHAPATLPPGKTRYPLYRKLDGPQGRSGWVQKISHANQDSISGPSSL
jgi:hypothetical protein